MEEDCDIIPELLEEQGPNSSILDQMKKLQSSFIEPKLLTDSVNHIKEYLEPQLPWVSPGLQKTEIQ